MGRQEAITKGVVGWSCDEKGNLFTRLGKPAAKTLTASGYLVTNIRNYIVKQHHIVWFLTHGVWPIEIDHKDRVRTNNAPTNLRVVDRSTNNLNTKVRKDNTTGYKGITYHTPTNKWQVRLQYKGVSKSKLCSTLGYAILLRKQWEKDFEIHSN